MFKLLSLFSAFFISASLVCSGELETADNDAPKPTPSADVVTPPAKENFHIYLLMGQSNMAGRGSLEKRQTKNLRVLALAADGQWVVAKDPMHSKQGRTEPGVGPGIPFAIEMLKTDPKITIGLVPCAVGGSPLKRWVKNGDLYKIAIERAKAVEPYGIIKGVLWHQGETDASKQAFAESYEARLTRMFSDLRQDLGQPDLPIVVGQLGEFVSQHPKSPFTEPVRAALANIPKTVPHVGFADSAGLKDKGDKLHFNTDAQKEFGKRYAHAMYEIQKQK
ncbi:MAG: sialate O-acetylesterase [Luteolibacter sp.]